MLVIGGAAHVDPGRTVSRSSSLAVVFLLRRAGFARAIEKTPCGLLWCGCPGPLSWVRIGPEQDASSDNKRRLTPQVSRRNAISIISCLFLEVRETQFCMNRFLHYRADFHRRLIREKNFHDVPFFSACPARVRSKDNKAASRVRR